MPNIRKIKLKKELIFCDLLLLYKRDKIILYSYINKNTHFNHDPIQKPKISQ